MKIYSTSYCCFIKWLGKGSWTYKHVWDQLFTVNTIWNIGETGDIHTSKNSAKMVLTLALSSDCWNASLQSRSTRKRTFLFEFQLARPINVRSHSSITNDGVSRPYLYKREGQFRFFVLTCTPVNRGLKLQTSQFRTHLKTNHLNVPI